MSRVGLIVNPIAGLGGRVGLKGTDGLAARARALGATPLAAERASRALSRLGKELVRNEHKLTLVAAVGAMGAELVRNEHKVLFTLEELPGASGPTTAADTRAAAAELLGREVELILFAGGDGTARDVHSVVGDRVPLLGIPTGVKMHSSVFAASPESAGEVAAAFLAGSSRRLREAEIVDLDEDAAREGRIEVRLHGAALVPDDRLRMQPAKARSVPSDEAAVDAACRELAASMDPRRIYVLGPGTTTRRVAGHLGLPKTLLGIDAVRAGRLVGSDLGERELLALLEGQAATLVVGIVGGQGALLGRGNQQLSPAVLRLIGLENVEVVAGLGKLLALDPPWLRVDTGDPGLDSDLAGYRRVHVAPRRDLVFRVAA